MTRIPPLLPQEVLARVLRVARVNGMGIMMVAAFCAVVSAMSHDFVGAAAGLIIAGAGAMELHGGTLLQHYEPRGINWLINSELVALLGILAYCAVRLTHPQLPPIPDEMKQVIALDAQQLGMTSEQFVLMSYRLGLELFAVLSGCYQGGVAFYYARRRRAVITAVETEA